MTAAPDGRAPTSWVTWLDPDYLRGSLGEDPVRRGSAYYRTGAVQSLAVSREGLTVLASVRGSHGRTYQTIVTAEDGQTFVPGAPPDWRSRCSCPMQVDCKHVVALILAARERQERQERFTHPPVGPAPAWESALRRILQPPAGSADYAPIALQLELVTGKPSRYAGSPPPSRRLRIRPVTRGKNGGWIRTGMSWRDLEYSYRTPRPAPAQREAALALFLTARSHLGYYGSDQHVHLADLGHSAWRLLHDVRQAGIPLVRAAGQVHLPTEPAALVLDARQPGEGGQLTLSTRLRVPGADGLSGFDASGGEVGLVGEPPHGIVVEHEGDLVLARLDHELEPGLAALLRDGPPLVVPAAEVPQFFMRYYPALRQLATVESSDGSVTFPQVEAPKLAVAVRFEPGHVTSVRWTFAYAVSGRIVHLSVEAHPDADRAQGRADGGPRADEPAARDRAAERALLDSLDVLDAVPGLRVPVGGHPRLVPDNRIRGLETAVFVAQVLPALQDREDVLVSVEGTPLDYVEVGEAPSIAVSASDSTRDSGDGVGTDWFDLGITVSVGGEEVPFGPLFSALANGESHLILDTGTWFSLDRPELSTLARLIEEARSLQDRESTGLRLTRWHAGLWEELVELGVVAHQSERWTQTAGALLDLTSIPTPDAPAGLAAELRDYQREGYHWLSLLWDHQLGGVLADDMGLGKTLQTLAMATRAVELGTLTPQAPLLIVAPTSVVSTWQREAARFCPELQVTTVTETSKRRGRPLSETVEGAHLVVTSFAILRLDEDRWQELPWGGLVLDEAQFVKNYQAKTYQVARRLPAPFKLAITGTPLENSLMDLWALLSIVAPGLFPNPQRFTELYRRPIESGQSPELLAALRRRIRPLMLRRTKEEVAADLPPKIEQVLSVTLNPQHQRIYQTRLQRERQRVLGMLDDVNRNRIAILSSLTVLRQLSLDVSLVDESLAGTVRSSKIDALLENLAEVVAEGHRVLVFSQFTRFLRLVRDRLSDEGIAHVYLDGRTRNRDARIAEFTRGDAPVFLISLKAGGSGLTLTEADYVFVLDPWWNPATEAQAVDRTHRIGQDKTVMVYRMVAEGTIEEKVVALQERKRDLFARVVEADGLLSAPLSADDIRGLLDP